MLAWLRYRRQLFLGDLSELATSYPLYMASIGGTVDTDSSVDHDPTDVLLPPVRTAYGLPCDPSLTHYNTIDYFHRQDHWPSRLLLQWPCLLRLSAFLFPHAWELVADREKSGTPKKVSLRVMPASCQTWHLRDPAVSTVCQTTLCRTYLISIKVGRFLHTWYKHTGASDYNLDHWGQLYDPKEVGVNFKDSIGILGFSLNEIFSERQIRRRYMELTQ